MNRPQPRSTRTDTLFPYTTLFRSDVRHHPDPLDDLARAIAHYHHRQQHGPVLTGTMPAPEFALPPILARNRLLDALVKSGLVTCGLRSEERRVGQECVSTGRTRWSPCP